jgi:hypothetical protein
MDEIFIGYSRRDSGAASVICDYLTKAGFSCYLDVHSIPGGDEWMDSISAAIGACNVYVAILSAESVSSKWVGMELLWGIKYDKRFVPVTLQSDLSLPPKVGFALEPYQFVDASGGVEKALPTIGAVVARFVDPVRHPQAYSDGTNVEANANFSQRVDFSAIDLIVPLLAERGNEIVISGKMCKIAAPAEEDCTVPLSRSTLCEFVLELAIRRAAGPRAEFFGIEFGQSHPGDYYQLVLNGDGAVSIQAHTATGLTARWHASQGRKPWAQSPRIDFRAVRKGSALHLFMDGSHIASCEDGTVREGQLRLFAGKGLSVDFSEVRVRGFDLARAYREAWAHREALEQREACAILERVVACNPSFCAAGAGIPAAVLLGGTAAGLPRNRAHRRRR